MPNYSTLLANLRDDQEREDERHRAKLAALSAEQSSAQKSRIDQLSQLRGERKEEERRRFEREQEANANQAKILDQQANRTSEIQTVYANQKTTLIQHGNTLKAEEKDRQMKEKADFMTNQNAQLLKAENNKRAIHESYEKRLAEQNDLTNKLKEIQLSEKERMTKELSQTAENQMQQRHQLELETHAIIQQRNQSVNDYDQRMAFLTHSHRIGNTLLVEAFDTDQRNSFQKENLRKTREKCSSIKKDLTVLFHKFEVPIKLDNLIGVKSAAGCALISITNLTADITTLTTTLGYLEQDEKRKRDAQIAGESLTSIHGKLLAFHECIKDTKKVVKKMFDDLKTLLQEMVDLADKMKEIIDKIPDFETGSNFMKTCIQQMEKITAFLFGDSSSRIQEIE